MPDFLALSRKWTRSQFVEAYPCPFLVGTTPFAEPRAAMKTFGLLEDVDEQRVDDSATAIVDPRTIEGQKQRTTVLAIRKMTMTSPDAVTIGRTEQNDLILPHPQISTRHASFHSNRSNSSQTEPTFTLADNGSRNGTWVSGRLLEPKGPPSQILTSGDTVRLAQFDFVFLTSAACWDVLRVAVK